MSSVTGYEGRATITPHTLPDDHGRQQYTVDWITEGGRKRGQVFRALLEDTVAHFRRAGYAVHVSEVSA